MPPRKKNSPDFTLAPAAPGGGREVENNINVRLADFLDERLPDGTTARSQHPVSNRWVDIVVEKPGAFKVFIEAKVTSIVRAKEHAQQHLALLRPEHRPTHIGALFYSPACRGGPDALPRGALMEFSLLEDGVNEWTAVRDITAEDLSLILANPRLLRDTDRDAQNAVSFVKRQLEGFVFRMKNREAGFARVLECKLPPKSAHPPAKRRAYAAARDEALTIGGLVIVNAMMFSSALNRHSLKGKGGARIEAYDGCAPERLKRHWKSVEDEINYVSILAPARELVDAGACDEEALSILKRAADKIRPLAERGVDILGRIFHTVLAHAKTYAAFFTGIPGATLMTELALNPDRWEGVDWSDPESIGRLRICDPACGSGTLIGLAAAKLRRNFQWHTGENGGAAKLRNLQRRLIEDVVHAADVVPAAAHLAATSVALISPDVAFKSANVFRAPIGVFGAAPKRGQSDNRKAALGSLHHLAGWGYLETHRSGKFGERVVGEASQAFPALDACLMNPPFVSGRNNNKSFTFAGDDRGPLQEAFRQMGKREGFRTTNGSMGPAFLALAAKKIKPGGRIALILPAAFATSTGKAWSECRQAIEGRFDIEALIASKDPLRPAFSDSTDLSELMLIAKRHEKGDENTPARWDHEALFVVLRENHCAPDANEGSRQKALEVAAAINEAIGTGARRGKIPGGTFARMKWRNKPVWAGLNFVDFRLASDVAKFSEKGFFAGARLPVVPLEKAAVFGGDHLHTQLADEKLLLSKPGKKTAYAGYYQAVLQKRGGPGFADNFALLEDPHCYLHPGPGHEAWARKFYEVAGRIVVNGSFGFSSARRLASLVTEPVQASNFWPVTLVSETDSKRKAMTLWMNSTLIVAHMALVSILAMNSKVAYPQAALSRMPALDFRKISGGAVRKLAREFDRFVKDGEVLQRLPAMAHDSARARLDDAVADALGIDKVALGDLRARLAREPIISNKPYSETPPDDEGDLIPPSKPARKSRKK